MNVIALQVFVSLMLVAGSLLLFVHSVLARDHEHADRMALAPLEEDPVALTVQTSAPQATDPVCESKETGWKRNG